MVAKSLPDGVSCYMYVIGTELLAVYRILGSAYKAMVSIITVSIWEIELYKLLTCNP